MEVAGDDTDAGQVRLGRREDEEGARYLLADQVGVVAAMIRSS